MNKAGTLLTSAGIQTPPDAHSETDARLREIEHTLKQKPFRPHPLFTNGHAQTIVAFAWPRRRNLDAARRDEARTFEVEPGVRVLVHCHWQTNRRAHPTLVVVHGLEGSSESNYVLGTAEKAYSAGFNALRLNLRTCGDTHHLTPTLYHSGMTHDLLAVVRELIAEDGLTDIFLGGYSLGGNMSLKLAGEEGERLPRELRAVFAVSPPVDLAACAEAIRWRSNWIYQYDFMRRLRRRIRIAHKLYPDRYDVSDLHAVRTIREFDARFTAPVGGFRDVDDYYARASALPLSPNIHRPALIIHAQDDPFIPFASFRYPRLTTNPSVVLLTPPHGGHVGFVADKNEQEDR